VPFGQTRGWSSKAYETAGGASAFFENMMRSEEDEVRTKRNAMGAMGREANQRTPRMRRNTGN